MLLIDNNFVKIKAMEMGRAASEIIKNNSLSKDRHKCILCGKKPSIYCNTFNTEQVDIFICRSCFPNKFNEWYGIIFGPAGMVPGSFMYQNKQVWIQYHETGNIELGDIYDEDWMRIGYSTWVKDCLEHEQENPYFPIDGFDYLYLAEKKDDGRLFVMTQPDNGGAILLENTIPIFSTKVIAVQMYRPIQDWNKANKSVFPLDIT